MAFQIKKAVREKIFVKVALMAPSGGGKTYGALRLATGMAEEIKKQTGKDVKILLANTEAKRGYYYANEFEYDIVDVDSPHNPEKYVELIAFAETEGYDILILDSSSHEWEGKGGCLELQQQAGGTYQAWGKITPRHDKFIQALANCKMHTIATMRGKDQYEMEKDQNGKTNVKKLGVGAKQRDGFEYEFTCTFLIDQKTSMSEAQKDNTHLFENEGAVLLSEAHGKKLIQWANSGSAEYTPIVSNDKPEIKQTTTTEQIEEVGENIKDIIKEIVAKYTTLKSSDNEEIKENAKEILKKYHSSGNPNKITDIEEAKKCLEEIGGIE